MEDFCCHKQAQNVQARLQMQPVKLETSSLQKSLLTRKNSARAELDKLRHRQGDIKPWFSLSFCAFKLLLVAFDRKIFAESSELMFTVKNALELA